MPRVTERLAGAVKSSVVLRVFRLVIDGSLAVALAIATSRSINRTLEATACRLQRRTPSEYRTVDDECVITFAEHSVILMTVDRWMLAAVVAGRGAHVRRWIELIAREDLPTRVRLVGWALGAAVAVHTLVLGIVDAPVQVLGWSVRGGLISLSLLLWCRPQSVAAAWAARVGSRTGM